MTFDFDEQNSERHSHERFLDAYFAPRFAVIHVGLDEQRRGIDRLYIDRQTGVRKYVEYKADSVAARTHNAFVETVSVDRRSKPGWALTCEADELFYYIPGDELLYIFDPKEIRRMVPVWQQGFPTRKAKNDGYWTHGVCVPLAEFERYAQEVVSL